MTKREIIFGLVIIGLVIYLFLEGTGDTDKLKNENAKLKLEIIKHKRQVDSILFAIEEYKLVANVQAEKDSINMQRIKELKAKLNEIHNPQNDPVPEHNARNDSLRKWAGYFQ